LGRFASLPLGLRRKLRDLESLASRLEVAVKPPAFNVEPDLELLCRNVMEARMEYRPCRHMDPEGVLHAAFYICVGEGGRPGL
jgi:hypothetical protein